MLATTFRGVNWNENNQPGATQGLTEATKSAADLEWEPLFIGRDLTGWEVFVVGHRLGENPNVVSLYPTGERVEAAEKMEHESGQWNVIDLYCWNDSAVHVVNGVDVFTMTRCGSRPPDCAKKPGRGGSDVVRITEPSCQELYG